MSEKGFKERDLGGVRTGKVLTWGSLVLGNQGVSLVRMYQGWSLNTFFF